MSNNKKIPFMFIHFVVDKISFKPIAIYSTDQNCITKPNQAASFINGYQFEATNPSYAIEHTDIYYEYIARETRKARGKEYQDLLIALRFIYEEEEGLRAYVKPIREMIFLA